MGVKVGGRGFGVEVGPGMTVSRAKPGVRSAGKTAGRLTRIKTRLAHNKTPPKTRDKTTTFQFKMDFIIYTGRRKKARPRIR